MKKINLYVFIQIFKSCTLVFFIFISIAWLLQISRLFSVMNNLQIEFTSIFFLSTLLLPNLINIILPFVFIFGLILSFIKLDRDKEIMAIYSLGLSINHLKKPLYLFFILIISIYIFLNLFISPFMYEKYKKKEFELRNLINLEKINISNFIQLDKSLIIDFKRNDKLNIYEDIFINFKDKEDKENIIYAKKGYIENNNENYLFNLISGFKISINNENEVENLEFENYKLKFDIKTKKNFDNFDKDTQTIFDLINDKKINQILAKFFDSLIVLSTLIFFYLFIIKKNNYKMKFIMIYLIICIIFLIFHNVIKNIEIDFNNFLILNISNQTMLFLFIFFQKFRDNE